ncbi:ATP-dependent helicase [Subsaximicrobium wynnwilliamsii]|uniref:DNA 3'-5' helicase n=1 Tax=Subsaximicrobium wynnwilliamsii TaxID=291179 RepID=A0A5C6ZJD9_9FLAO|nr:ATP-dependent helicase [Subsaximicrobium wynnwilliamsii]TXD84285.1 ATP-dependent helicase [Subsaximicrobium wynnwilliamsii]TXD89906.1 ATP-dependent helicase [Subsaximicrobium wynnwilliamsii]TXE03997.1 ATP-dependent helicase [Subsaximicrobium wynnwilliamsii]
MENHKLNEKQKKAVGYEGKHLLVLAGAGTGKTRCIVGRAAYLIEQGIAPEKIQILTFTKRSASEIVERVKASLTNNQAQSLNGSTFHSWCNQLIVRYPNLFGAAGYTVIDPDDQLSVMKMVCGDQIIEYKGIRIKPQQLIDIYSYGRNTRQNLSNAIREKVYKGKTDAETTDEIDIIRSRVEVLLKAYQTKKGEGRYIDYDDLLLVVANRLRNDAEARDILSHQLKHLLIDEFQDTNPLQWYLLEPFLEIAKFYCVGDDAQSIYSFRGADYKNVHLFKQRVPESEILILDKNYRSTQEILDVSNWLIAQSPLDYDKELQASRGSGMTPKLVNVASQWEEANFIAENILENFTENNKQFADHLILSKSTYYTKPLQAVFIQKKIPYVTYGGRKFMEAAHIKDVISALRVVNNHFDEIGWMRFLTFWDGIGEIKAGKYISQLVAFEDPLGCAQNLADVIGGQEGETIADIYNTIYRNAGNVKQALQETYSKMEQALAFKYRKDWEEKRKSDFPVLEMLGDNYASIGQMISEGILENAKQLNGNPVLEGSQISDSEIKDHVVISTVHSAKGLEADVCYVLNVSPKVYPSAWNLDSEEKVEEDRRVLYVALTRAKNELYITRDTNSINTVNKTKNAGFSSKYFLEELPNQLTEQLINPYSLIKPRDISKPNSIDLSFGMDFS